MNRARHGSYNVACLKSTVERRKAPTWCEGQGGFPLVA